MASKKILAVIGATGSQGGAIVKHFLTNAPDKFVIRAITRDTSKPNAKALQTQGADVVAGDMYDQASLEKALQGANIVFVVTNFFDTADVDDELKAGKNIIHALQKIDTPALEQILWSTLPDPRRLAKPCYNIMHFNGKADITKYLDNTSLAKKTTKIWITFYMQNWLKYPPPFAPSKQPDGSFLLEYPMKPDTRMELTSIDDLGLLVDGVTKDPKTYLGKTVKLITQYATGPEMMEIWGKHLGVKAVFKEVTLDEYCDRLEKEHGWPRIMAIDIGENLTGFRDNSDFFDGEGVIDSTELIEGKATDWAKYVSTEDWSALTA